MADVIMPKMGDAMTEGKVLKWKKRPGEPVAKGEPIAEIETDKVNVDIEAEEAGVLLQILVDEGKSAPIGASIAEIGAPGQKVQPRVAAPTAPPGPAPAAAPPSASRPATSATPAPSEAADRLKVSPLARRQRPRHPVRPPYARSKGTLSPFPSHASGKPLAAGWPRASSRRLTST